LLLPGTGAGTGLFAEEEDIDAQAVSLGFPFERWQLRRVNLPNADASSLPFSLSRVLYCFEKIYPTFVVAFLNPI